MSRALAALALLGCAATLPPARATEAPIVEVTEVGCTLTNDGERSQPMTLDALVEAARALWEARGRPAGAAILVQAKEDVPFARVRDVLHGLAPYFPNVHFAVIRP